MENIKESLFMAMLENQAEIFAKLKKIERNLDAEVISRVPTMGQRQELVEQFKVNDRNEADDIKAFIQKTYERAEKLNKELNRDTTYFQDINP